MGVQCCQLYGTAERLKIHPKNAIILILTVFWGYLSGCSMSDFSIRVF